MEVIFIITSKQIQEGTEARSEGLVISVKDNFSLSQRRWYKKLIFKTATFFTFFKTANHVLDSVL